MPDKKDSDKSKALVIVNYILDKTIKGVPPLTSCKDLAQEYLIDEGYDGDDERVDSLINWETSKNFTTGFLTGLGGVVTLPISVPSALGASWIIQARLAGAIAVIYGHSLQEDRVRTLVLLALLGDSAKEPLKKAGIKLGTKLTEKTIQKIPGKVLIEINKKVGFRLVTKAGEKGVVNLTKLVPVAGGVVGGAIDAVVCRKVGYTAKKIFKK